MEVSPNNGDLTLKPLLQNIVIISKSIYCIYIIWSFFNISRRDGGMSKQVSLKVWFRSIIMFHDQEVFGKMQCGTKWAIVTLANFRFMISDQANTLSCYSSRLWQSLMRHFKNSSTVVNFLCCWCCCWPTWLSFTSAALRVLSFKERQLLWCFGPMLELIKKKKVYRAYCMCTHPLPTARYKRHDKKELIHSKNV